MKTAREIDPELRELLLIIRQNALGIARAIEKFADLDAPRIERPPRAPEDRDRTRTWHPDRPQP